MNKRQIFAIFVGILTLATGVFAVRMFWFSPVTTPIGPDLPLPQTHDLPGQDAKLSGPYTHKNLTVYLIHGSDVMEGKTPLTLEEAMERKLVVVHETEDVNELAIENVSQKEEVYVQAGDIVKGGKQDRVLAVDLIVPARSGRMPIDAFCVEHGRWTPRGAELSTRFESSNDYVASKDMKIAAKHSKSQTQVWNEVETSQGKLSAATNSNTASSVSRSSLPLTLENSRVRADSGEYVKVLSEIVEGKPDVIGFLFAINGEINSADTYGSSALFLKLWPKLLKASAIEAVAESDGKDTKREASIADIEAFFETSENATVTDERSVTDRIRMITLETKTSVFLESFDRSTLLHRNYILR
jgi:hypothetical protein